MELISHQRSNETLKKVIWTYIILLLFEGALRKWFLPSLSNVLLIIRDPLAIYLVVVGFKNGWLKNIYAVVITVVTIITFFLTLTIGHQNLFVAIYGCRITLIYFPLMFVIGKVLCYEDVLKVGRFILYISVLVSIIITLQYFSPQSALINRAVGGAEGEGFGGVGEYFRPSGIFSFILVLACFMSLVCPYLFWFILNPKQAKLRGLAYVIVICYIISMFVSLSRTIIFQTALTLLFVYISSINGAKNFRKIIVLSIMGVFFMLVLLQFNFFKIAVDNIFLRFDTASESEGSVVSSTIGERYFGSFYRGLFNPQNLSHKEIPFFGFGQGMGTNAAITMMGQKGTFLLAEEEWSRVVDETGFFFGWIILFVRLLFGLSMLRKAYFAMVTKNNSLPFFLMSSSLPLLINGQLGVAPILGFFALFGGLSIAALKGNAPSINNKNASK